MNPANRSTSGLPSYVLLVLCLFMLAQPLAAIAQDTPNKNPKDIITTKMCQQNPGNPDCPPPKCPPDCLYEMELNLADAGGKKEMIRGDRRTVQKKITEVIDASKLTPPEKADAKKIMRDMILTIDNSTKAKKKPTVAITCSGGPTTSPTGGTGGSATCGFTVTFGGGK